MIIPASYLFYVHCRIDIGASLSGSDLYEACAGEPFSGSVLPNLAVPDEIIRSAFEFGEPALERVSLERREREGRERMKIFASRVIKEEKGFTKDRERRYCKVEIERRRESEREGLADSKRAGSRDTKEKEN